MDIFGRFRGTERALLQNALLVFAEKGFEAATVREISSESRCAVGSIYSRFGSKEGLRRALVCLTAGSLAADLSRSVSWNEPLHDVFLSLWDRLTFFATRHSKAAAFLWQQVHPFELSLESLQVWQPAEKSLNAHFIKGCLDHTYRLSSPALLRRFTLSSAASVHATASSGAMHPDDTTYNEMGEMVWAALTSDMNERSFNEPCRSDHPE